MVLAGVAGLVLVVAGIGIVMTLSRKDSTAPTAPTTAAPAAAATVSAAAPSSPTPPAQTPIAPPVVIPSATVQAGGAASGKSAERTAPKPAAKSDAPTAQELALFRSLQSSALDSRRHASDAGATPEQLRAGDDHNTAASTAVEQGKVTEAASHLTLASTAWATAERDARAAAAAAAAAKTRATVSDSPKKEVVAPPPTPVVVTQPAPVAAPPRTPAANPAADIGTVVSVYEKAIESRDISEVRRAYPGLTSAQAGQWEQFFRSVRSIKVSLSVSNLDVKGDAADARLTGAYDYISSAGKSEHQPANFQATFLHDGGVWKLMSVR
jgi:hypothetical protein